MSIRSNRIALAAAALGLAIAGSAISATGAEASPRHGWGHHGHGGHVHCRPIRLCNPGFPGHGHGHGGWHGGWHGGGWGGTVVVGDSFPYGHRCRLVERVNRWGEVVVRRVCRPAHWR
jgi:hypothetical protein